ncbi:MAG: ketopantoate reductase family protein [Actinomycetota bacterium]|nr:ketopantoate reductase family protein [Actinomycetota bacterium]
MRYLMYGAGGVGGVIGARLHLAGYDVGLVARGPHLKAIRRDGLRLESPDGSVTVRLPAGQSAGDVAAGEDTCVLLSVKGQDTAGALRDLSEAIDRGSTVACVQNGVANERAALRQFDHVLGVCVMLPATHLEPGVVIAGSAPVPGMLDVGCYPAGADARAELLAEALRVAGFDSVVRPDVMAWKHRKLLKNLGNAVQAICASGEDRSRLSGVVLEEGERVLAAAGVEVVSEAQDNDRRGNILSPGAIGGRGGGSTWQSLARGQGSVESDYLNGEISLLGRLHGVPTPANDLVRRVAWEVARAKGRPGTRDAGELLELVGLSSRR